MGDWRWDTEKNLLTGQSVHGERRCIVSPFVFRGLEERGVL